MPWPSLIFIYFSLMFQATAFICMAVFVVLTAIFIKLFCGISSQRLVQFREIQACEGI